MSEPVEQPVVPVDVGEVIAGKYKIGGIIGFGGMATVAAAHHLELDQPVAIKFLHPEAASRADAVRRFLSEARSAARLNSPHVARVLDVGTAPTTRAGVVPYMVMELLEGMDLDAVIQQRGRLPVAEAVEYVWQACAGVAEAHALHIIHRDLKPGNLFLTRRRDGAPVVKLLDFGISKNAASARHRGQDPTSVTADQDMMGSPRYMSPEQFRSSKDVDTRTDIWSLGVILHELLAGAPPFKAKNVADTFVAILHSPPQPIAQTAPDVPKKLVEVVMKCLQKSADGRYATVEQLAEALAPFRSTTPLLIAPLVRQSPDDVRSGDGVSVHTVRALPQTKVVLTAMLSFAAVGLVLIVVAGFTRFRHGAPPLETATTTTTAPATTAPPPADDHPEGGSAAPAESTLTAAMSATAAPAASNDVPPAKPKSVIAAPKPPTPKPGGSVAPRHRTDW